MHKQLNSDPQDFSFSILPKYSHFELSIKDDEALLLLNIEPQKNLHGNTPLKLNSYDLGVDIELADIINRLRFSHPSVRVVTISSAHKSVFSAGANIYMLKKSSHAFKVNFCKFTNETRLYMEEASRYSHKKFLCALNGSAAGGGYELALACDRIILVDDKAASVSLPEVPLLGVLPGTGGLSRLSDKRQVRRDLSDVFCTLSEGVKGQRAKDWLLVDEIYPKSQWDEALKTEVSSLKSASKDQKLVGIKLDQIAPQQHSHGFSYKYVDVRFAEGQRKCELILSGPQSPEPTNIEAMLEKGSELWLLRMARELDDAILRLRFFHKSCGLIKLCTLGDRDLILQAEKPLYTAMQENSHWFLRELLLQIGRVFRRLDTSSRSMYCSLDEHSAFVGLLAELLFIADRSYALDNKEKVHITLSSLNNGLLNTWSNRSRLELRFDGHQEKLARAQKHCTQKTLDIKTAYDLELITFLLDDIDFSDEVRLFEEERSSLSPDALSAMEANIRFGGAENMATKIFGRLSAWQNWVFNRNNATGPHGALISYGEEFMPEFDWERC